MKRIGIAPVVGQQPAPLRQIYFAITSNTVQSGARVELYAAACCFNIYGFVGYDLLVHFDPFHFVTTIAAGLALRRDDDVIAGIDVSGELSGPTPWHTQGSASFKILFVRIRIGFNETWGDDAPSVPPTTVEVLALVEAAVNDVRNWRAELPPNTRQTVTLRKVEAVECQVLLHPFGVLG
jgi:hypothetical protein